MKFIPPSRLPGHFRDAMPKHYLCKCTKCDYVHGYVTGEFTTITIDGNDDDDYIHVDKVPKVCPKCGAKLHSDCLPDVLKY